jgi:hypothetical protein
MHMGPDERKAWIELLEELAAKTTGADWAGERGLTTLERAFLALLKSGPAEQSPMTGSLRAAAASIVAEFGYLEHSVLRVEALRAALKRAADVEALDEWHSGLRGRQLEQWTHDPYSYCELRDCGEAGPAPITAGPTPDEARAKAVAWINAERKAGR